jgi:glucosylceramidase
MVMLALSSCKDSTINDPKTKDLIGDVSVWLTTISESYLLSQSNSIDFSDSIGDFSIVIDTTRTFQRIDGFGAALTGSSAYLIQQMNSADRNKLLKDLFDPASGIGINYLRITIGSSDFSIGTYSYCDNSDISTFAIPQRDKDDLIPVLKQILNINPTIKILASPWSAPAWMKSNNSMLGAA